ncbi:MAG: amidohydrolase [Candidatus Competibacterales bacterium]
MVQPRADVVLTNGRIFTGLASGITEAIAIKENRILAAGKATDIEALAGPGTRQIDLRGRAATPGINDGHQHLLPLGLALEEIDLRPPAVRTLEGLLEAVKARTVNLPPNQWITGGRYDHFALDVKRHPTRDELDRAAPDHPVYLRRTCGHMGVANSRAMALAGLDEETPDMPGGHLGRHEGRLTGLMQERAQELITNAIPAKGREDLVRGIEAGGLKMLSLGITSVMDAGVGLNEGYGDFEAYLAAKAQQRLPVRAYLALLAAPDQNVAKSALEAGYVTGTGDDRLKIGPAKLFTDGSAGGRTAAMTEPYWGGEGGLGLFIYDDATLFELVAGHHALGFQVSIHAIGDAAIDQTIRAYHHAQRASAMEAKAFAERRHRIEHCGFVTESHHRAMAELGLIPAPQPIFMYEFGDLYLDVLGPSRSEGAYPLRRWLDDERHPIASSDAPVSSPVPATNLYQMITRKTQSGRVLGEDQRVTLAEALHAYTHGGAWGSFCEATKGTLTPGQLADVAVWSADLFDLAPEDLLNTVCDLTLLDGQVVFDRTGEVT